MQELIQHCTKMKVLAATNRIGIVVNAVYLIPPNKNMSILNGSLYLIATEAKPELRLPIEIIDYARPIQENPTKSEILFKEILIGITFLFPNSDAWIYLRNTIILNMLTVMTTKPVLRARVVACSTGEEVHSLAITVKKVIDKLRPQYRLTLQICAVDLDFQAIEYARIALYPLSIESRVSKERIERCSKREGTQFEVRSSIGENLETRAQKLLLQQLSPDGAIITDQGEILFIIGSTDKYLDLLVGKANMNVFSMAREGIRSVLSAAVRKAGKNNEKVVLRNLKVKNRTELASVSIQQIELPEPLKGKFLLLFNDEAQQEKKSIKTKTTSSASSMRVSELEGEINKLNNELQTTVEEKQSSQEALKSINDDLHSMHEVMHSTNEEFAGSQEEMQILNQELHTTNRELQREIDHSFRVSNEMYNLLNIGEIATLFLDKAFQIRHFTPAATQLFQLISTAIERLFTDLATELDYPTIFDDDKEVLKTLTLVEEPIKATGNRWLKVRSMPYKNFDDLIDAIVITFINISIDKQLDLALSESQLAIRFFADMQANMILELYSTYNLMKFNTVSEPFFTIRRDNIMGKDFFELFNEIPIGENTIASTKKLLIDPNSNTLKSFEPSSIRTQENVQWSVNKLFQDEGILSGFLLTTENTNQE
jgi:PAS domain-containing protein